MWDWMHRAMDRDALWHGGEGEDEAVRGGLAAGRPYPSAVRRAAQTPEVAAARAELYSTQVEGASSPDNAVVGGALARLSPEVRGAPTGAGAGFLDGIGSGNVSSMAAFMPPMAAPGEPAVTTRYLREIAMGDLGVLAAFTVSASTIAGTEEYRSYVDPKLKWQWQAHAMPDEALLACRFILFDLAAGKHVSWDGEARHYLMRARAQLGKRGEETKEGASPEQTSPEPEVLRLPNEANGRREEGRDTGPDSGALDDRKGKLATPVLPEDKDMFGRYEDLEKDLRHRGENEQADKLRQLLDRSRGLLSRLAIFIGGFTTAILYSNGRVALVWKQGLEAGDLVLQRALHRAEQIIPELEESLGDLHREGLRVTDARGAGILRPPRHHVFPHERVGWFVERGFTGDLHIDNFCVELEVWDHQALHGGGDWRLARKAWADEWNNGVMAELERAEAAMKATEGRQLNVAEISRLVFDRMDRLGMPKNFVPYRDRVMK